MGAEVGMKRYWYASQLDKLAHHPYTRRFNEYFALCGSGPLELSGRAQPSMLTCDDCIRIETEIIAETNHDSG
jgi:hypothetical protein